VAALARVIVAALAGRQAEFDMCAYLDAAARLLEDPESLYAQVKGGYIYPPPAVLVFVPLSSLPLPLAYLVFFAASLAAILGCWWLTLRLYEGHAGGRIERRRRRDLLVLTLTFAPVLQTLKIGQINALVLLAALLVLVALERRRPFAGGIALAMGFWLKLYPMALAGVGVIRSRPGRFVAGIATGLALVPLAALPLVPRGLYAEFFGQRLPQLGTMTNLNGANQSITGVVERLGHPLQSLGTYEYVVARPESRAAGAVAAVILIAGLYTALLRHRSSNPTLTGVVLLAALPLISPLGWEHTFVFALPLCLWLVIETERRPRSLRFAAGAIALTSCVQKPPDALLLNTVGSAWSPLWWVFYLRYTLADLAALALAHRLQPAAHLSRA
jgi:hypothetical protein